MHARVVVVTSAGWGMAWAVALAFAKEGAGVAINDIDLDPAQQVVKEVEYWVVGKWR